MGTTLRQVFHPRLNGNVVLSVYYLTGYQQILISSGQPCDAYRNLLPPNVPPPPLHTASNDDWTPYTNHTQFETADLLYQHTKIVTIFLLFHNLFLLVCSCRVHILFGMCRYDYVSLLLVIHPFHLCMIVL